MYWYRFWINSIRCCVKYYIVRWISNMAAIGQGGLGGGSPLLIIQEVWRIEAGQYPYYPDYPDKRCGTDPNTECNQSYG